VILHDVVQYSSEWWTLRAGIPTASAFDKIMTPKKCELSKQADDYIRELIGDKYQQIPNFFSEMNRPKSRAMEWGSAAEEQAREFYRWLAVDELKDADEVQQVGFVTTDDGRLGCSPDCLVLKGGEYVGLGEIKCPMPSTHVGYLLNKTEVPADYLPQVHGQLIVTGLPWVDWISFCPGFTPVVVRVTPNDYTAKLRAALDKFLARYREVEALLAGPQPAARPEAAA
jgi:hypothetical protein